MQAALVTRFELGATDCAVFREYLPCDVLVFVATMRTTVDAAQHGERLQAVLAFGAAGCLQTNVRLVALHCLEASTRAIAVVRTALRKKRGTLRALHLLWRPAQIVLDAPRPCCFVVTVLVAVLRVAVAVVEHAFALCAPLHCFLPLFTAEILG